MFYLSEFCCLCLQNKQIFLKLEDLNGDKSYYDKLKLLLSSDFIRKYLLKNDTLICINCCQYVDDMHNFQSDCKKNIKTMYSYLSQLREISTTSGQPYVKIDRFDVMKPAVMKMTNYSVCTYNGDIKIEIFKDSLDKPPLDNVKPEYDSDEHYDDWNFDDIDEEIERINEERNTNDCAFEIRSIVNDQTGPDEQTLENLSANLNKTVSDLTCNICRTNFNNPIQLAGHKLTHSPNFKRPRNEPKTKRKELKFTTPTENFIVNPQPDCRDKNSPSKNVRNLGIDIERGLEIRNVVRFKESNQNSSLQPGHSLKNTETDAHRLENKNETITQIIASRNETKPGDISRSEQIRPRDETTNLTRSDGTIRSNNEIINVGNELRTKNDTIQISDDTIRSESLPKSNDVVARLNYLIIPGNESGSDSEMNKPCNDVTRLDIKKMKKSLDEILKSSGNIKPTDGTVKNRRSDSEILKPSGSIKPKDGFVKNRQSDSEILKFRRELLKLDVKSFQRSLDAALKTSMTVSSESESEAGRSKDKNVTFVKKNETVLSKNVITLDISKSKTKDDAARLQERANLKDENNDNLRKSGNEINRNCVSENKNTTLRYGVKSDKTSGVNRTLARNTRSKSENIETVPFHTETVGNKNTVRSKSFDDTKREDTINKNDVQNKFSECKIIESKPKSAQNRKTLSDVDNDIEKNLPIDYTGLNNVKIGNINSENGHNLSSEIMKDSQRIIENNFILNPFNLDENVRIKTEINEELVINDEAIIEEVKTKQEYDGEIENDEIGYDDGEIVDVINEELNKGLEINRREIKEEVMSEDEINEGDMSKESLMVDNEMFECCDNNNDFVNEDNDDPLNIEQSEYRCQLCNKQCRSAAILMEHKKNHMKKRKANDVKQNIRKRIKLDDKKKIDGKVRRTRKKIKKNSSNIKRECLRSMIKKEPPRNPKKIYPNLNEKLLCMTTSPTIKDTKKLFIDPRNLTPKKKPKETIQNPKKTVPADGQDDRTIKCRYCPKMFKAVHNLHQHMRHKHKTKSERRHECDICGIIYSSTKSLKRHRLNVHNISFKCKICNQMFITKIVLEAHIKNHLKVEFQCEFCGGYYSSKKSLIIHQRLHQTNQPYRCNLCLETFTRSDRLLVHVRKHNVESLQLN